MNERYDLIILGTGEAGIFAAYEMAENARRPECLCWIRVRTYIIVPAR